MENPVKNLVFAAGFSKTDLRKRLVSAVSNFKIKL